MLIGIVDYIKKINIYHKNDCSPLITTGIETLNPSTPSAGYGTSPGPDAGRPPRFKGLEVSAPGVKFLPSLPDIAGDSNHQKW